MQKEWKAQSGYYALARRSVKTVLLARKISRAVRNLELELQANPKLDPEEVKARWAALHRANAKLAHNHIVRYRGLLTKVGQAASVKAGELPKPWVDELHDLQDQLPTSSIRDVHRTIRNDLKRPVHEIFRDFSDRPIASASVAQAHAAKLNRTGQKVCVKVQHRGIEGMVGMDLRTVGWICRRAARFHSNAPDPSELIQEWRRAAKEEVDFRMEAVNASRASKALERLGLDVGCATPIPEACGRRVLTMEFIEGFKITDTEKFPHGTDKEALGRSLVDAIAALAFEEGLIHGDPHPGNIFAEYDSSGGLRPALLDWGIVQRLTQEERTAAARWTIATLAQDRVMYMKSLLALGFQFDAEVDEDSTVFNNFLESSLSSSLWMFRDSIPSGAQLHLMDQMNKIQEKSVMGRQENRSFGRVLSKVPGVVLFFLRALGMLQQICGILEVSVPFAEIIAGRALPLLQQAPGKGPRGGSVGGVGSPLEAALQGKIKELQDANKLIGAQIAVCKCGPAGTAPAYLARLAAGSVSIAGHAVSDSTLMPLVDASFGVLLLCLFQAFSRPTVGGKKMTLQTPIAQVWPDFAQRDKANLTIAQVLQHQAGLLRLWPSDMTVKKLLAEESLEQVFAAAPRDNSGSDARYCQAVGSLVATLLRRATGYRETSEAVRAILEPHGLDKDISAYGNMGRHALASRRPRTSLPLDTVYEWLDERIEEAGKEAHSEGSTRWLTWQDLGREKSVYVDALIVNRDGVRRPGEAGDARRAQKSSFPGRGLRATAAGLCELFANGAIVGSEVVEASKAPCTFLRPQSVEEWEDSGVPLEVSVGGWRLFRFLKKGEDSKDGSSDKGGKKAASSLSGGEEIVAFGCVDPTTGSLVLRLPDYTVSILLNCVDRSTRHVGQDLLNVVAGALNLQPLWDQKAPEGLVDRARQVARDSTGKALAAAMTSRQAGSSPEVGRSIRELEAKVASLTQAVQEAILEEDEDDIGSSDMDEEGGEEEEREHDDELSEPLSDDSANRKRKSKAKRKRGKGQKDGGGQGAKGGRFGGRRFRSLEEEDDESEDESEDEDSEEEDSESGGSQGIVGTWESCKTEGLDEMLEAFEVPKMMRSMAARASRVLTIGLEDEKITMKTSTSMLGKMVEETETTFRVGDHFDGEQALGGQYKALAWWEAKPADPGEKQQETCLVVEKHFLLEGNELVLEERIKYHPDGDSLALTTTMKAPDDKQVQVNDDMELELLTSCLDPDDLTIQRAVLLGQERILRSAKVIDYGPKRKEATLDGLTSMKLPGVVTIRYRDMDSTTTFKREGASDARSKTRSAVKKAAALGGKLRDRASKFFGFMTPSKQKEEPNKGKKKGDKSPAKGKAKAKGKPEKEATPSKGGKKKKGKDAEENPKTFQDAKQRATDCVGEAFQGAKSMAPLAGGACALAVAAGGWALGSVVMATFRAVGGGLMQICGDDASKVGVPEKAGAAGKKKGAKADAAPTEHPAFPFPSAESPQHRPQPKRKGKMAPSMSPSETAHPLPSSTMSASMSPLSDDPVATPTSSAAAATLPQWIQAPLPPPSEASAVDLQARAPGSPPPPPPRIFASDMDQFGFEGGGEAAAAKGKANQGIPNSDADDISPDAGYTFAGGSSSSSKPPWLKGPPTGRFLDYEPQGYSQRDSPRQRLLQQMRASSKSAGRSASGVSSPRLGDPFGAETPQRPGRQGQAEDLMAAAMEALEEDEFPLPLEAVTSPSQVLLEQSLEVQQPNRPDIKFQVAGPGCRIIAENLDPGSSPSCTIKIISFCAVPDPSLSSHLGRSELSNHYGQGSTQISLQAPCELTTTHTFQNASAALEATKFWALAQSFTKLTAAAAASKARRLASHADSTYAGFGSSYAALSSILQSKYGEEACASVLLSTGDAFLLAHDPTGEDSTWCDGGDGRGQNHLGMLLMLIREQLSLPSSRPEDAVLWEPWLSARFHIPKGLGGSPTPKSPAAQKAWSTLVQVAFDALDFFRHPPVTHADSV